MKPVCIGNKKDGEPCKNTALEGKRYCRIHLQTSKDVDEDVLDKLNRATDFILEYMHAGTKDDFHMAASDQGIEDIGIYLMAILNRLYKAVDYYEIDLEPEWQGRIVKYTKSLYCQYCEKEIVGATHIKQLYCNNLCAKHAKEKNKTGIVHPSLKPRPTEEEQDRDAMLRENKRLYGVEI